MPTPCPLNTGRANLFAGKRKSVTVHGGRTGHRPAERAGRGAAGRGPPGAAAKDRRPGSESWGSRSVAIPPPRWLNKGLVPSSRRTDLRGRNRPSRRPPAPGLGETCAKEAPPGSAGGPRAASPGRGGRPRLGYRGQGEAPRRRRRRECSHRGAAPARGPAGPRRPKPGSPRAAAAPTPRRPGPPAYHLRRGGRRARRGSRRAPSLRSDLLTEAPLTSQGLAGASGPDAAAHVTRCPPLLRNRPAWQRPAPAVPPNPDSAGAGSSSPSGEGAPGTPHELWPVGRGRGPPPTAPDEGAELQLAPAGEGRWPLHRGGAT